MLFKSSFDFCGIIEVKNNRRSCEIFHTRSRKIPRFCLFFSRIFLFQDCDAAFVSERKIFQINFAAQSLNATKISLINAFSLFAVAKKREFQRNFQSPYLI
jgi:hypothetical protein